MLAVPPLDYAVWRRSAPNQPRDLVASASVSGYDERLDPQRVADIRQQIRGRLFATAHEAEHIGRFELIGPLGAGAMGTVHLAFDPDLDRQVALKVLKSSRGPLRDEYRQRLVREAQALARMNHPNVAGVYEVGSLDSGDVFIAMEYAQGETLTRWLGDGERSWQEIAGCFQQAARGLSAAHDRGLVHRDFKPDNVVIGTPNDGAPPVVKVVDFGLARLVTETDPRGEQLTSHEDMPSDHGTSSLTRTGVTVGTPVYMAPEQHLGESGPASDQFLVLRGVVRSTRRREAFLGRLGGHVADGQTSRGRTFSAASARCAALARAPRPSWAVAEPQRSISIDARGRRCAHRT